MNKKTIILILIVAYILIFGINTTYSMYNSKVDSEVKLDFAKIIFNNEAINSFSLPISNLIPGESLEYKFKVSNNKDGNRSEINIGYSITIETFNIVPATIELYNIDTDKLILNCNAELFDRNAENKLICNTEEFELDFNSDETDNYKIQISFAQHDDNDSTWTEDYSELIDFIDIKINSWQIVE